eukprot:Skav207220  [mRNA]  locus=scaffold1244:171645:173685:+ [translate_table: standard]
MRIIALKHASLAAVRALSPEPTNALGALLTGLSDVAQKAPRPAVTPRSQAEKELGTKGTTPSEKEISDAADARFQCLQLQLWVVIGSEAEFTAEPTSTIPWTWID